MDHRWAYRDLKDDGTVEKLSRDINVNPILASVLVQRKIKDFNDARAYFRPVLENLHDPFLMEDMDLAVKRLTQAVHNQENILIYGDYDVDGTTSVALVYSFLRKHHTNLHYYLPDRYSEGYGISKRGIDEAYDKNVKLVISLDCGIMAMEMAKYATSRGIDLIICDHHLPGKTLPEAIAILDPKRKGCRYPYKELSGCGVGYKFMQDYCRKNEIDENELLEYIDLLAVS